MAKIRKDDGEAFLPDPDGGPIQSTGGVGDEMLEDFMRTATSGEDAAEDVRNQEFEEDHGGPFVTTSANQELAGGVDESNPADADRAARPSPMRER